jgi:lantibiotic modifying enzyme
MMIIPKKDRRWILKRLQDLDLHINELRDNNQLIGHSYGALGLYELSRFFAFGDPSSLKRALEVRKQLEFESFQLSSLETYTDSISPHLVLAIFDHCGYKNELSSSARKSQIRKLDSLVSLHLKNNADHELINGTLGALLVAHHLNARKISKKIIKSILASSWQSPLGLSIMAPSWYLKPYYDIYKSKDKRPRMLLGNAHGIAGVISALHLCRHHDLKMRRGIISSFSETLLAVNNECQLGGLPPTWPHFPEYGSNFRTAWCTGDAGIGFSLYQSAFTLPPRQRRKVQENALEIFLRGVDPKNWSDKVTEETFCHGAAGNAQMCSRIYQWTGSNLIKKRFLFWLSRLDKPIHQIITVVNTDKNGTDHLTTGFLGISLTLLSAITNNKVPWDHCYLLSKAETQK